jgi:plastocyanin
VGAVRRDVRILLVALAFASVLLSGCGGSGVKEFDIHIGWNEDGKSQYMNPSSIRVDQNDKVRFVVYNDDDPDKDYNGDRAGKDNFHDVALLDYDGNGDGTPEDIEHEAVAGRAPARTSLDGKDYFVATLVGTFKIICEVRTSPTHEELGMKAAFIVE